MTKKFSRKFYELEDTDPWTKKEKDKLNIQDRNFIRGIQISQGVSKKKAVSLFNKYLTGNLIENKKNFRKRAQQSLTSGGRSDRTIKFTKKIQGKNKNPIRLPKVSKKPFASKRGGKK
jgi:hypothetical protein